MKASDIQDGGRYLLAVTLPGTPKLRATRSATVVSKDKSAVVVEVLEQVCVNLDEIAAGNVAAAMIDGELRYELQPVRRTVRAADIVGQLDEPADAGVA